MISTLTEQSFKERNRITQDTWDRAEIGWQLLQEIGLDHESRVAQLEIFANMLAGVVQQYQGVHSVRWRVKDPEHLLEKIVRKRAAKNNKYSDIDLNNYYIILTDLVGVRALHLFKSDAVGIDYLIRQDHQLLDSEPPIIYKREGDPADETSFNQTKFEHKDHPSGYRSIHYIIKAQPQKRSVYIELQVRTIFEEGWSEIDHSVRYPNFEPNVVVEVFLQLFNRLAGQADEMGSFVKSLEDITSKHKVELALEREEKNRSWEKMESLLAEVERRTAAHQEAEASIESLKNEISRMRDSSQSEKMRNTEREKDYYFRQQAADLQRASEAVWGYYAKGVRASIPTVPIDFINTFLSADHINFKHGVPIVGGAISVVDKMAADAVNNLSDGVENEKDREI